MSKFAYPTLCLIIGSISCASINNVTLDSNLVEVSKNSSDALYSTSCYDIKCPWNSHCISGLCVCDEGSDCAGKTYHICDPAVHCSGRGRCVEYIVYERTQCRCDFGYDGENCQQHVDLSRITGLIIGITAIFVASFVLCLFIPSRRVRTLRMVNGSNKNVNPNCVPTSDPPPYQKTFNT